MEMGRRLKSSNTGMSIWLVKEEHQPFTPFSGFSLCCLVPVLEKEI